MQTLTNERRHGGDATEVAVRPACPGDRLEVTVTDDGTAAPSSRRPPTAAASAWSA
ncbi:hypothetical protein [Streptomyces afghaniensis]|uniref:hypothetical protein n=1 Tax=Streptomyces afghaniensis TaxID=66865 RepID=UPI0037BA3806